METLKHSWTLSLYLLIIVLAMQDYFASMSFKSNKTSLNYHPSGGITTRASAHIVLTKDDRGQSLVLTGEDGKGGKGKGKGGGGGDNLVISGNMGGDRSTNMVMQDAGNREGDVVINGNNMIVPGEDGHIVLADGRNGDNNQQQGPAPNPFAFWLPYLYGRSGYARMMMPYFGGQFG